MLLIQSKSTHPFIISSSHHSHLPLYVLFPTPLGKDGKDGKDGIGIAGTGEMIG